MIKQLLLTSLILLSYDGISQTNDSIAVIKCFDRYKKALQEKNGAEVYRLLDKNTVEWYAYMLEKIKFADSMEVSELNLNDKMTVLATRLNINRDSILQFDARTFCIYSINKSVLGGNSAASVKIQTVSVNGQKAKALVHATPQGDSILFEFNQENGSWKFNLSSIFKETELLLKKYLSDNGMSENEYALHTLEIISNKKPTNTLWKPLVIKSQETETH